MNSDATTSRAPNSNKRKETIMTDAQTEEAVLAGEFEVVLAGEPRIVKEKPLGENMKFRRAVGKLLVELLDPITPFLIDFWTEQAKDEKEAKTTKGKKRNPLVKRKEKSENDEPVEALLRKAFSELMPVLLGEGADELILVFWLYAPELEKLKAKATFEEQVEAGLAVLGVIFPLVVTLVKGLMKLHNRI